MKKPITVAITGASGNIGYAIVFRIAAGDLFGPDQPVNLHLIEIEPALLALRGVEMELRDCAFPTMNNLVATSDLAEGFSDADCVFLIGSRPRSKGMERSDLLSVNGVIFKQMGKNISDHASKDVKVLVVGNPANTNALITLHNGPNLQAHQVTSMMRLDQNRAVNTLAEKTRVHSSAIKNVIVWGNHSNTQYPDINYCRINNAAAFDVVNIDWYKEIFIDSVRKRGAKIIEIRGLSSAASAASAAIDHMRDWALGVRDNDWVSMGIYSTGSYNITEGLIFSVPVFADEAKVSIIDDLELNEFSQEMIKQSEQELLAERDLVREYLP